MNTKDCEHCGKVFKIDPKKKKTKPRRFCTPNCARRALRTELKQIGICTTCYIRPNAPGKKGCEPCMESSRRRQRARYAQKRNRSAEEAAAAEAALQAKRDEEQAKERERLKRKAEHEAKERDQWFRLCMNWPTAKGQPDPFPWKREMPLPSVV